MFVRNEFNYDMNEASVASGLSCEDPSLTKQSFAEEADINAIVRRFGLTGQLPSNVAVPVHGDFRGIGDFHSAMELIRLARESFMQFPAEVRGRFLNNPARLVDFVSDPKNLDEAVKLGIVTLSDAAKKAREEATKAAGAAVVKP